MPRSRPTFPKRSKMASLTVDEAGELCRRARAGDQAARDELVASVTPMVFKITQWFVSQGHRDYDDCVQEVFMRVVSHAIANYEPSRGVRWVTYCWMVARREALRCAKLVARRDATNIEFDQSAIADAVSPDDEVAAIESAAFRGRALANACDGLPMRQQAVLAMRYGLGGNDPMTFDQIGRVLGCTREWVRRIHKDAIDHLKSASEVQSCR